MSTLGPLTSWINCSRILLNRDSIALAPFTTYKGMQFLSLKSKHSSLILFQPTSYLISLLQEIHSSHCAVLYLVKWVSTFRSVYLQINYIMDWAKFDPRIRTRREAGLQGVYCYLKEEIRIIEDDDNGQTGISRSIDSTNSLSKIFCNDCIDVSTITLWKYLQETCSIIENNCQSDSSQMFSPVWKLLIGFS